MKRHSSIKTAYISSLNKERVMTQNSAIFMNWFQLFLSLKMKYDIQNSDIYNMNEKGFMMKVIAKLRVMISKHEKKTYMTQSENRE